MRALGIAVCLALLGAATASGAAQTSGSFKTPSGNIVCVYAYGDGGVAYIQCGIKSGLKPPPPKPKNCEGDYVHDRVSMTASLVSAYPCAGDVGPYADARRATVLGYGSTWRGGPFTCSSAQAGLTCKNRAGHGFFLSRERWKTF